MQLKGRISLFAALRDLETYGPVQETPRVELAMSVHVQ